MLDTVWTNLVNHLADVTTLLVTMPVNVHEKFYFVYIGSFVLLAFFSYHRYYRKRTKRGFFAFLFPWKIYGSASARVDYGIFLVNLLISPMLLITAGLQAWLSIVVGNALVDAAGGPVFRGDWSTGTYLAFILGYTLMADLSVYIVHRLHHEMDVLWPIHKLHHSATVLTPVTLFRKHPVWNLVASSTNLALTGLFQGIFVFVFFGGPAFEILFGINSVYVLYNLAGANLRHSHVWLSFGPYLSYLFISPAMHQIHHDPNRMRKNYGEVFAIWDWLFGTLYVPKKFERFEIGLGNEGNPHNTLLKAYVVPLVESWQAVRNYFARPAAHEVEP